MFNIFKNSLSLVSLSTNCQIILYADDILLFKPIDSSDDLQDFQQDLQNICNWIQDSGLRPNHVKTQLLPITRSRNCFPLTLTLDGHTLVQCSSVKYLGVVITSNLTWSQHIDNTCRSSKRQLGRLHRQFRHVPQSLRRKIYTTTTLPKLDYCCTVWGPTTQHTRNS